MTTSNGARHFAVGPTLGINRDPDGDGQPNATSTGDDANGIQDDEDGVFAGGLPVGTNSIITVNVSGQSFLNAWIDWNRDGDWNDIGEAVVTNQALALGNNNLVIAVPLGASLGTTFGRFRLTSGFAAGALATGILPDGEVEDHALVITPPPNPSPNIIINEVDSDTAGVDNLEFVELYDGGIGNTSLDGLVVVFYDGSVDRSYAAYSLNGHVTNASGYFTLGNNLVMGRDLIIPDGQIQNGADAVALYVGSFAQFPFNTPVTTNGLIDAVVYDNSSADDPGLLVLLNALQPQVDENGSASGTTVSMQRCPNATGGLRNTATYAVFAPTADRRNTCTLPNTQPGINITAGAASGNANVTFTMVAAAGETTFTPINPASVGSPPIDFSILGTGAAFDVTTTAAFVPPVVVCFTVGSINDPAEFSRVRILHREAGILVDRTILPPSSPAPDFASRTVCARVSSLSPFVTALAPPITVSGRVTTPAGIGLRNAVVTMTDSQGFKRTATTSSFGVYTFENVKGGETYIIGVSSKRYRFGPRTLLINEGLTALDFVGLE